MISVDQVTDALGIGPASPADTGWLGDVVDAVNAWVGALPAVVDRPEPSSSWPADVTLGAIMLAVHQYHSRSAPYGRAGLDTGGGFQSAYADPEIARLLRLRRWARPSIAGPS